jgi:hypothetical protein
MTYLEPNRNQERPTDADVRSALASIRISSWPLAAPALDELLDALRQTHANGGALFARFRLPEHPILHWFGSRNRWEEIGFFEYFLSSEPVRQVLPELQLRSVSAAHLGFEQVSSSSLDGELAQILVDGGAYRRFAGTPQEAKRLTERATYALIANRFDEVVVYRSWKPWSPWFYDVAWDTTWLGVDRRYRSIWLLCVTDTD